MFRSAVRDISAYDRTGAVVRAVLRCGLFYFSSRRRHTRLVSDWSSDVCSSDLTASGVPPMSSPSQLESSFSGDRLDIGGTADAVGAEDFFNWSHDSSAEKPSRSEERRVGKECRSRGSPDH